MGKFGSGNAWVSVCGEEVGEGGSGLVGGQGIWGLRSLMSRLHGRRFAFLRRAWVYIRTLAA